MRATGDALISGIERARSELGGSSNIPVVIIAGDGVMSSTEIASALAKLGRVVNVQNPGGERYIPMVGLFDLALRIAYDLGDEKILACLNSIALNPDKKPFGPDDIEELLRRSGVIHILPKIVPVNLTEVIEAYKAAQSALESV